MMYSKAFYLVLA